MNWQPTRLVRGGGDDYEAIEIARRYCSDDAPTFVNGVLDRIARVVGKKVQPHESLE